MSSLDCPFVKPPRHTDVVDDGHAVRNGIASARPIGIRLVRQ
jgi:hypothetical protein